MVTLNKIRAFAITVSAIVLIFFAVVFSLMRAALPHATSSVVSIEQELSSQLGMRVDVEKIDADMYWLVPRLKVLNLRITDHDSKRTLFEVPEVNVALDWIGSLTSLSLKAGAISLHGIDLKIERRVDGIYSVQGLELSPRDDGGGMKAVFDLLADTTLILVDSEVHWKDNNPGGRVFNFSNFNVRIENYAPQLKLEIDLLLPKRYGSRLTVLIDSEGDILQPSSLEGSVYFDGVGLNAENILDDLAPDLSIRASGLTDLSLWLDWKDRQLFGVVADISARRVRLKKAGDSSPSWEAESIAAVVRYAESDSGKQVDLRDLVVQKNNRYWSNPSRIQLKLSENKWSFSSSYLRLENLIGLHKLVDMGIRDEFWGMNIEGELLDVQLSSDHNENKGVSASAEFVELGMRKTDGSLSIRGLDGKVTWDDSHRQLSLNTSHAIFDLGAMFRQPLAVARLEGDVSITSNGEGWEIHADRLWADNSDIQTESRLHAIIPHNGDAYLDIQTDFKNAVGEHAYKYYPVNILSSEVVDWLDHAIVDGRIPAGSFVFTGKVGDFPFANGQGVMEVVFDVEHTSIHYLDGWPDLLDTSSTVRFHNESLSIKNSRGKLYGGGFHSGNLHIADLNNAYINLSLKAYADAEDMQKFVQNSGLKEILGTSISQFVANGDTKLDLALGIPVEAGSGEHKVNGKIHFVDNKLHFPVQDYRVTDVNGDIAFTESSLNSDHISASMDGQALDITIDTDIYDTYRAANFSINGNLSMQSLFPKADLLHSYLDGSADWLFQVIVPYEEQELAVRIRGESELSGAGVHFSEQIHKAAGQLTHVSALLDIHHDNTMSVALSYDEEKILVDGKRDADKNWTVNVNSPALRGKTLLHDGDVGKSSVKLQLEYLDLNAFVSSGQGGESVSPYSVPSIELESANVDWKDSHFTDVTLKTTQHRYGMVIDALELSGPSLHVTARGRWLSTWRADNETQIVINMQSDNVGDAMSGFGYTDSIRKGKGYAQFDWRWYAEPYRFDWTLVEGQGTAEVRDGIIRNVDPGAARLYGLINILALPRRLTLDFGDVTSKGFSFDKAKTNMSFKAGDINISDLSIRSTVGEINISGRTNLVNETYDLDMFVIPESSTAVMTIGALVGVPVVGAGVVLLQKLFGADKILRMEYTVDGTWEKPVVNRVDIESDEQANEEAGDAEDITDNGDAEEIDAEDDSPIDNDPEENDPEENDPEENDPGESDDGGDDPIEIDPGEE